MGVAGLALDSPRVMDSWTQLSKSPTAHGPGVGPGAAHWDELELHLALDEIVGRSSGATGGDAGPDAESALSPALERWSPVRGGPPAGGATPAPSSASVGTNGTASTATAGRARRGPRPRLFKKHACQADDCSADLSAASFYYQRNHICTQHLKAGSYPVRGVATRFCQRCGVGHPVEEFDGAKRSCKRALDRHNQRRRGRGGAGSEAATASTAGGELGTGGAGLAATPEALTDWEEATSRRGPGAAYAAAPLWNLPAEMLPTLGMYDPLQGVVAARHDAADWVLPELAAPALHPHHQAAPGPQPQQVAAWLPVPALSAEPQPHAGWVPQEGMHPGLVQHQHQHAHEQLQLQLQQQLQQPLQQPLQQQLQQPLQQPLQPQLQQPLQQQLQQPLQLHAQLPPPRPLDLLEQHGSGEGPYAQLASSQPPPQQHSTLHLQQRTAPDELEPPSPAAHPVAQPALSTGSVGGPMLGVEASSLSAFVLPMPADQLSWLASQL